MYDAPTLTTRSSIVDAQGRLAADGIVALAATMGALFIGEVMGQMPCVLFWFQRLFMFPLGVILGIAILRGDVGIRIYALPLAAIGLVVSGFHGLRFAGIIPEAIEPCGKGPSCARAAYRLGACAGSSLSQLGKSVTPTGS